MRLKMFTAASVMTLALVACSDPPAPPPSVRPVVVMTVTQNAQANLRIYSGEVRARNEVDLSFRVGGKLAERSVGLGAQVKKGQVLARLDGQDIGLSAAAAQAQVAALQADMALAQNEYERARSLNQKNFISASAVDARRAQLDVAKSRLQQAQAQASVSANQVSYTSLRADRDGVITTAPVEAGQVLTAGQTVVRLADPALREVLIWIPEARIADVALGQKAIVRPWNAQHKDLSGVVREVAAAADPATRTYAVRIAVAQKDNSLTLGSTAAVGFAQERDGAVVSVPLPALVNHAGQSAVWVVDAQDRVQSRAVQVARLSDDLAVIASGLTAGDRVAVAGAHALVAGQRVRPVAAQAPIAIDAKR